MIQSIRPSVAVAVRTLFGVREVEIQALLEELEGVDLRQVFRKRALESHPDRASILGRSSEELTGEFKSVAAAYEVLKRHVGSSGQGLRRRPPAHATPPTGSRPARSARPAAGDHEWALGLPNSPLRLGQFLYYARRVSWRVLIQALAWQAQQRPRFGRIAEGWQYASAEDIRTVLAQRRLGEPIGEAAVRLGVLTPYQRDTILGMQKRKQRRLGDFFVEGGFLSQKEMDEAVRQNRAHNLASARPGHNRRRRPAA